MMIDEAHVSRFTTPSSTDYTAQNSPSGPCTIAFIDMIRARGGAVMLIDEVLVQP
jgi:hypothetical protein